MQIPHISPIEDFTDLLNMLGSKTKFGERLTAINQAQEMLNKSLDRFKEVTDIENTRQQAAGLLADAREVKANADSYGLKKHLESDEYYATQVKKIEDALAQLALRKKDIEERESAVDKQTNANITWESELKVREAAAAAKMTTATERQKEAETLAATLRTKLNAFNQIAAD